MMPDVSTKLAPTAGLLAQGNPVPLEGVRVEAEVRDLATRVTLTQRYRNSEPHPIEAVYVFPLDEAAAVCGFEVLVDGAHVVGEVKERDAAFEAYDDALAAGHGAYLLDQERPDVFAASVGNVPSGKEVLVKISYVAEMTLEGDDLRFVLPTTVSPRYAPEVDRKGVGRPPAEAVNPPLAWRVPYGLELSVRVEMASAIRGIESPSHPIAVEMDGPRAVVTLGERTSAMDRDFVLLVRLSEPQKPRAWFEKDAEHAVVMVAFQPRFEAGGAPCEAVFVIDRSGSMQGSSIAEARNALQLCLRSLPAGSRFNIVGFGSTHENLFAESRPYTDESLREASRHIEQIQANLGGTEILPALESVLAAKPHPELPRQLFVLTDGQVTNTDAVIALVRRHSDTTRVFTFGIGAGASHHLVRGMARAGEGASETIFPGERIEAKVLRQLERALSPALTDVRVHWGGLEVEQAPYRLPPVFAGKAILAYGLISSVPEMDEVELRLDARGPKGPLSFAIPLRLAGALEGNLIGTLAAKALLRDLEEGSSALHDRRGSLQERAGTDRVKNEAVRIGVKYGLASRWTSFVAVEKRESKVEAPLELRRIPVALTRDWGGLELSGRTLGGPIYGAAGMVDPMAMPASASLRWASAHRSIGGSKRSFVDRARQWLSHQPAESRAESGDSFADAQTRGVARPSDTKAEPPERALDRLVRLQKADGSWELDAELAAIVGKRLKDLERVLTDAPGPRDEARRAWATALAIAWLEKKAPESRDEWRLLVEKARKFLESSRARLASGEDWLTSAKRLLG